MIFVIPVTFIGLRQNPTAQGLQTLSLRGRDPLGGQRHMFQHPSDDDDDGGPG